jgi:glycosyltransferase involved in cell wall biosynthesis
MSKVSIIVPVYNAGKKLHKCIQSILNQTFTDFELILVNDGSTDNSLDICSNYKSLDKRINLINKKNEGSILTRKRGVEIAKSDYVMFVDADDWINKNMVKILYNETVKENLDVVVCNIFRVVGMGIFLKHENDNRYFKENKVFNKKEIIDYLASAYLHGHPFPSSLCAKLYKKEILLNSGKYLDRIIFLGDDLFYNLEIFLKANRVKMINKPLYFYRLGGFTSKYMPYLFDDMVNGYKIQKEVIEEYYLESKQQRYNGISIMLLNTFKTCLYNLFIYNFTKHEIIERINEYVQNESVIECLSNSGSIKYFPVEYLQAIKNNDIEYLYQLGNKQYKRRKPRRIMFKILSKVSVL